MSVPREQLHRAMDPGNIEGLAAENERLRDVLKRHHLWHIRGNTEHAMEYRDSALAADTRQMLKIGN